MALMKANICFFFQIFFVLHQFVWLIRKLLSTSPGVLCRYLLLSLSRDLPSTNNQHRKNVIYVSICHKPVGTFCMRLIALIAFIKIKKINKTKTSVYSLNGSLEWGNFRICADLPRWISTNKSCWENFIHITTRSIIVL